MQRLLWIATLLLSSGFFFPFEGDTLLGQSLSPTDGNLALVGGTIYPSPSEEPIHDGVVLIQDGKIVAVGDRKSIEVPTTVPSIDCTGLTQEEVCERIIEKPHR